MGGFALLAHLGLDTASFKAGLVSAKRAAVDFASSTTAMVSAALSLGGVISATKAILDFTGDLEDTSDALNIAVEDLQELQYVFAQSGTGTEVLKKGLLELTKSIQDAKSGNEKTIATFERLGVTWSDLNTRSPDEILMLISDSAAHAVDPVQNLADVCALLGKSGVKMAAGLKDGADGIKAMRDNADKLGDEQVKALDDVGDALSRVESKLKTLAAKFLANGVLGAKLFKTMYVDKSIGEGIGAQMGADIGDGIGAKLGAGEIQGELKGGEIGASGAAQPIPKSPNELRLEAQLAALMASINPDKSPMEAVGDTFKADQESKAQDEKDRSDRQAEAEKAAADDADRADELRAQAKATADEKRFNELSRKQQQAELKKRIQANEGKNRAGFSQTKNAELDDQIAKDKGTLRDAQLQRALMSPAERRAADKAERKDARGRRAFDKNQAQRELDRAKNNPNLGPAPADGIKGGIDMSGKKGPTFSSGDIVKAVNDLSDKIGTALNAVGIA